MGRVYRVGVIGCGAVASLYDRTVPVSSPLSHAGAYHVHPRTELVAAADPDVERLRCFGKKWGVRRLYSSAEELLEGEAGLDVVSICSPTADHVRHLEATRSHSIPCVFLEKPVAHDAGQAQRLAEFVHNSPGVAVNYYRRWSPYFSRFREELQAGVHGTPSGCRFLYMKGLLHNGTHFLDLAEWLFGHAAEVRALRWPANLSEDGVVDAMLTFESGVVAYLIGYPGAEGRPLNVMEMDLMTDQARIAFEKGGRVFRYYTPTEDSLYPGRTYFEPSGEPVISGSEASFIEAVDNLVGYLDSGEDLRCTLREGLRALHVGFTILESARSGGAPIELSREATP